MALYHPPRPNSLSPIAALVRTALKGEGDLLSLLPASAYRVRIGPLGYSRRSILVINDPELVRTILTDPTNIYPKNDLMVGALAPLVGDSLFVSNGETWRRQRAMIAPAFSAMRVNKAFACMTEAVAEHSEHLGAQAARGEAISLDLTMSHLTADIICRTVFSTSLKSQIARDVFEAFTVFERSVAHVELKRLIFDPPFQDIPHHAHVLDACERIRRHLGELVDEHVARGTDMQDIAAAVMAARDEVSGEPFTRPQLIDQLGVFFLAGHETTASALTWIFFILGHRPEVAQRMRAEVQAIAGDGPVQLEHIKPMLFIRNVFREALRLYPPITFIPRVAAEDTVLDGKRIKRGAMIMIAPWTIQRHKKLWRNPDAFDPDRWLPEREAEITPGAYLPFGQGPRVCVGASFATIESTLILAELVRRFDFAIIEAHKVRPVARLTTRPAQQVFARITDRQVAC
jgi:cytochrome P450